MSLIQSHGQGLNQLDGDAITIDHNHAHVHDGQAFTSSYTRITASTDKHRSGIFIETPANKEIHAYPSFSCSAAAKFEICEDITINANAGNHGVEIFNRNRSCCNISSLVKDNYATPVANKITTFDETAIATGSYASGTVIRSEPLEVGVGPKPIGGKHSALTGFILKKAAKYLFLITNTAQNANVHNVILDWYEVD